MNSSSTLERTREKFRQLLLRENLAEKEVTVLVKELTPEEAIGAPGRRDFPIVKGKERMLEAEVLGAKGQAFTDSPGEFEGKLKRVADMELTTSKNRAVYTATLNAVLNKIGQIHGTVHCKDEEPELCAAEIARHILKKYGRARVGLIGLNPAIAEKLINTFGPEHTRITDLDSDKIGKYVSDVEIWDGNRRNEELIGKSDVVIITGTTLINDTFDDLLKLIEKHGKEYLVFGVTIAGVSALMGLNRICPYGKG